MLKNLIIGLFIGYIGIILYEGGWTSIKKVFGKEIIVRIKKWHVHHSMYGIALLTIWPFFMSPLIFGAGVGVILRHTQQDGFKFIGKN